MKFSIVLTEAEEGGYNVVVPALDGCFSEGDTIEEAMYNAKEAILCYIEGLEKVNFIKSQKESIVRELEVVF